MEKAIAEYYVLDVFMKKSKTGSGTPEPEKKRVRERFKAATRHYEEHYRRGRRI